jgi:hypothetical protein
VSCHEYNTKWGKLISLNIADFYGGPSQANNPTNSSTMGTGPNQSAVANSGQTGGSTQAPAFSWCAVVIMLVVIRIVTDLANK